MGSGSVSVFDDRRKVLLLVHLISAITLAFFSLIHYFDPDCFALFAAEAMLAVVMVVSCWFIRNGADLIIIENSLMLCAVTLFTALIFFNSIANTGIYWVAGYPFVANFVHPARQAKYWVIAFAVELVAVGGLISSGVLTLPYSAIQIFCLVSVILFFGILAYIYRSQLELRQQQLAEANSHLEQQQYRMQVILDHSPIGIWMVDRNLNFQFVNRTCSVWGEISESQLQQIEAGSLPVPKALAEKWMASDQQCLDSEEAYHAQEEIEVDGVVRTFDITKVKVVDSQGDFLGIVGFANDITDKVIAEMEHESLERQVQHSQRLEALGIMAGGVAHDFNNLLTAIQGGVELAKMETGLSDSMQESLACINSAAYAATDLCRQMLAYSGKGLMKYEPINVRGLIEEMHPLFEVSIGKHISFELDFDHSKGLIEGDRSQVSQVLLNLVTNAAEAIGSDKQGRILLSLHHQDIGEGRVDPVSGVEMKPGCYVVIAVKDNGCGMEPAVIEHMFDPFFTTKFTGRGLGLSAILGILRSHHAGMEVQSIPGKGSDISVWFPCYCKDGLFPETDKQPALVATEKAKVLVVDDEGSVAAVAKRMLEKLGQQVVVASNGMEAIELFSKEADIDWVLLDVTMPEMDGVACLKALRTLDPDVYVTMSSGYDAESALNNSAGCQPDDFLSKPYTFASLRTVVEHAAARKKNGAASA
ncbi:PAS domain S-box-containing protein [Mariprofundus ferrinatatus]|uniref:histidine kinase n=2 Tax=Mariprofundus ferrinatatus TaxID=1921087 RepID=A0A2K8L5U8_9PROT|nr:PAS domain S-box-containing protein [Mariprofundus ferrinatatus]